ncbi:hypothetical protein MPSEU_000890100 [Mayamaea pseudoterrestris]|nr:hypothetical protein MPSEU_000890100 [Mayamaea pseudoterrestris]
MVETRNASSESQGDAVPPVEASTPTKRTLRSGSQQDGSVVTTPKRRSKQTAESPAKSSANKTSGRKRAESDASMRSTGSKSKSPTREATRGKEGTNNEMVSTSMIDQDVGKEINVSVEIFKRKDKLKSSKKALTPAAKDNVSSASEKSSVDETEAERLRKRAKRRAKRHKSKKSDKSLTTASSDRRRSNSDISMESIDQSSAKKMSSKIKTKTSPTNEDVKLSDESPENKMYASNKKKNRRIQSTNDTDADATPKSKKPKRAKSTVTHEERILKLAKKRDKKGKKEKQVSADPKAATACTVNVAVHRVRYMNFHPKPILSIKATPPRNGCLDYLAISRDNGSVEIRAANEKLRVITTMAGNRNKAARVMAWTCSSSANKTQEETPNLVGGSPDGSLFLIDAISGTTRGMIQSGGGGVFSLVSLCQRHCCEGTCCQLVAAGCEDGCIRIFKVQPEAQALELVTTVPPAGGAVLSLAWIRKRSTPHESNIFAGVADGTIRRYDFQASSAYTLGAHGSCKPSVRMTVELQGRSTPTKVWALECLTDGTLISADSLGHVQIWDGNSGTLEQSFDQNGDKADVLTLAVTADENMVFASGVDSRVVCIERPSSAAGRGAKDSKWLLTNAQRPHSHDVNALAIYRVGPSDEPEKDMLVSGGIDTKLSLYDTTNFKKGRPKVVFPWNTGSIAVAGKARMFGMMREDVVELHRLADTAPAILLPLTVSEGSTLLRSIEFTGSANLTCVAISEDAEYLAVADMSTLYIFRLTLVAGELQPEQLKVEFPDGFAAQAMCFHQLHQLIIASGDNKIYLLNLSDGCRVVELTFTDEAKTMTPSRSSRASAVHISQCGTYVATLKTSLEGSFVDLHKKVSENRLQFWWTLPPLENVSSAVTFIEGDRLRIAVGCSDFSLYVFDVAARELDKWSEDAGYPVALTLPDELKQRTEDYPVRIFHDPQAPHKLFMGSFGAFVVFDLNEPFPRACLTFPETHVRDKKRKRGSAMDAAKPSQPESSAYCKLCLRYNSMLHLGYVAKDEMLVVEQPWLSVVATFPGALQRRVYGS